MFYETTAATDDLVQDEIMRGKRYTIVFLLPGPNYKDLDVEDRLHRAHLRHLFTLKKEEKLLINGPVGRGSNIRGVSIYNSDDIAEVRGWVEADPAVQAGRFTYEIFPWFSIPGAKLV